MSCPQVERCDTSSNECASGTLNVMPLYGPLHNYIEAHRDKSGLSQAELAFLIGIEKGSSVSRYELGDRTPNLESMLALEFVFAQPMRRLYLGVADGVRES